MFDPAEALNPVHDLFQRIRIICRHFKQIVIFPCDIVTFQYLRVTAHKIQESLSVRRCFQTDADEY